MRAALETLDGAGEGDARRIVEHVAGYGGADMSLHLDDRPTARQHDYFDQLVARRAAGEPLQYVLGRWGFRGLDLVVDRRVLIPRPETEVVAGVAIEELTRIAPEGIAVDLGTGSGAIALALADEVRGARVWGTDASEEAVAVARANLAGTGTRAGPRVRLVAGDWFGALPVELRGRVDVIVSNPPYVGTGEVLPEEVVSWEPAPALYAGERGTECLELIVDAAPAWLARPGSLVLEIAPHQVESITARCTRAGFASVEVRADLAGRDRVVLARVA